MLRRAAAAPPPPPRGGGGGPGADGAVEAGGPLEVPLGQLKVPELKACIAFRGQTPKGTRKAEFVSQLAKMLGGVAAPLLLTNQ